ncbi:MAG: cupin-like domain-containing protein [Saprospiraceae bacterium]|nr:cupin-like domain-containing protein [Saprospiraceae bacterium]
MVDLLLSRRNRITYNCFQFLDHFLGRSIGFKLTEKSRRRFYASLEQKAQTLEDGKFTEIDRVGEISIERFYTEYVKKGKPVVFTKKAQEWDCVKEWSFDYFKKLHGTDEIILVDQDKMDLSHQTTTLHEIIDDIEKGNKNYYRFYPLLERHPEHLADFDVSWLRSQKRNNTLVESFQVFMGSKDSYTPLHNSCLSNLFVQTYGKKKWRLYSNKDIAVIDPDPARNIYRHAPIRKDGDSFNAFEENYEKPFHLYKKINGLETTLEPGDVLYNPPHYWHTVKNIGASIGVGYRWLPLWDNMMNWPWYTFFDLTVRKPNFFKTIRLLKQDVNLLHLAETGKLKDYLNSKK